MPTDPTPVRRPVPVLDRAATEAVRERIWQRWLAWRLVFEAEQRREVSRG